MTKSCYATRGCDGDATNAAQKRTPFLGNKENKL